MGVKKGFRCCMYTKVALMLMQPCILIFLVRDHVVEVFSAFLTSHLLYWVSAVSPLVSLPQGW